MSFWRIHSNYDRHVCRSGGSDAKRKQRARRGAEQGPQRATFKLRQTVRLLYTFQEIAKNLFSHAQKYELHSKYDGQLKRLCLAPMAAPKKKSHFRLSVFGAAVRKSGLLQKRSTGVVKRWQERAFELSGHYLRYYDPKDYDPNAAAAPPPPAADEEGRGRSVSS